MLGVGHPVEAELESVAHDAADGVASVSEVGVFVEVAGHPLGVRGDVAVRSEPADENGQKEDDEEEASEVHRP